MENKIVIILSNCQTDHSYYISNGINLPENIKNTEFIEESDIDIVSEIICKEISRDTNLTGCYDNFFDGICNILYMECKGYRYNNDEIWVIKKDEFQDIAIKIMNFLRKTSKNY